MTSFGGNFIQAPNPIDFDKVFSEFTQLGETGNISVLVTIAVVFLVYFVVLIFARRADKRDESKVCIKGVSSLLRLNELRHGCLFQFFS